MNEIMAQDNNFDVDEQDLDEQMKEMGKKKSIAHIFFNILRLNEMIEE